MSSSNVNNNNNNTNTSSSNLLVVGKESIQVIAQKIGNNLSPDIFPSLAADVEYRLREIMQVLTPFSLSLSLPSISLYLSLPPSLPLYFSPPPRLSLSPSLSHLSPFNCLLSLLVQCICVVGCRKLSNVCTIPNVLF